jgi:putative restriction endonuclease
MKLFVGVTDRDWFLRLRRLQPDDVNFWRPSGRGFQALGPGDPFLFKLHAPWNAIVGGGFFVESVRMPVSQAWMAFGERNGVGDQDELLTRIDRYRPAQAGQGPADPLIGAIVLTQPFFLDDADWLPAPADWSRNIVSGKGYDASAGIGQQLWSAVQERLAFDRARDLPPLDATRQERRVWVEQRLGQGTFRTRVASAYGRRCAITGERTVPVLEAAHIRPYAKQGPNRVDNGLLLRSDLHRLFDRGLVTIEPDRLTVRVSERIRHEYSNGRVYYDLADKPLMVVPVNVADKPSQEFLAYHAGVVFRP